MSTAIEGAEGGVLYSGRFAQRHTFQAANEIAENSSKTLAIIDNTDAFKLLDNQSFKDAYRISNLEDFPTLFDIAPRTGPNSLWDDISRKFASGLKGDVITITPNADAQRVFAQTELPALFENPDIKRINGVPVEKYKAAFHLSVASGLAPEDAFAKVNHDLVKNSSIDFIKGYSDDLAEELGPTLRHDFMGVKDLPETHISPDYNRATNFQPPGLDEIAQKPGAMAEFLESMAPFAKKTGMVVLGAIPIIALLPNTVEAAELKDKLATAIDNGDISPDAMLEFNVIMGGHIAQGADPTVVLGEAGVQQSFDDWADRYDVQDDLRESLQPSSLALMLKDGGMYIAQNIERLPSATVDVAEYAGQTALGVGEIGLNAIDDTYDYLSGNTEKVQGLYDALPSVDLQEVTAGQLTGDHAALNERGDVLDLLQAKSRAEYFEDKMSVETDLDRQAYYGDRLQDARDDFETSVEAMDEGQFNDVKDYLATYNQYVEGVAAENIGPVPAQGEAANEEFYGLQTSLAQNRMVV